MFDDAGFNHFEVFRMLAVSICTSSNFIVTLSGGQDKFEHFYNSKNEELFEYKEVAYWCSLCLFSIVINDTFKLFFLFGRW